MWCKTCAVASVILGCVGIGIAVRDMGWGEGTVKSEWDRAKQAGLHPFARAETIRIKSDRVLNRREVECAEGCEHLAYWIEECGRQGIEYAVRYQRSKVFLDVKGGAEHMGRCLTVQGYDVKPCECMEDACVGIQYDETKRRLVVVDKMNNVVERGSDEKHCSKWAP